MLHIFKDNEGCYYLSSVRAKVFRRASWTMLAHTAKVYNEIIRLTSSDGLENQKSLDRMSFDQDSHDLLLFCVSSVDCRITRHKKLT